jgi:steroid delta-isomerase
MNEEHPALLASRASWRCVQEHDKAGWLELMAEDVCVEDPIGVAPTNADGKGVRGKLALAEFYDKIIAENELSITCHQSYLSSSDLEAAHVLTLTSAFPNGVKSHVTGIFTYRLNAAGKIVSLRGYWNMDAMTFEQPEG